MLRFGHFATLLDHDQDNDHDLYCDQDMYFLFNSNTVTMKFTMARSLKFYMPAKNPFPFYIEIEIL